MNGDEIKKLIDVLSAAGYEVCGWQFNGCVFLGNGKDVLTNTIQVYKRPAEND